MKTVFVIISILSTSSFGLSDSDLNPGEIIGYDCHSSSDHMISVSLQNHDNCNEAIKEDKETKVNAQLLYQEKFSTVNYVACYIHLSVDSTYCRGWPFEPVPLPPEQTFIDVSMGNCKALINQGFYIDSKYKFDVNLTNGRGYKEEIPLAGTDFGNSCSGTDFTTLKGLHKKNTVAFGTATIRVKEGQADYRLDDKQVIFHDGSTARFEDYKSWHPTLGYVYWTANGDTQNCTQGSTQKKLFELFRGPMTKIEEALWDGSKRTTYYYEDAEREFFIIPNKETKICDEKMFSTQSSNLFIVEEGTQPFKYNTKRINFKNIDERFLRNMALSKLERHIGRQIRNQTQILRREICEVNRRAIFNELNLVGLNDRDFGFTFFKREGFLGLKRGEVAYIRVCAPQKVIYRPSNKCYDSIPVSYNNESYFITARSKILVKDGIEIPCSLLLAPQFYINNRWYKAIGENLIETKPPVAVSAIPKVDFEYQYDKKLADHGFLSEKQYDSMKESIGFHLNKDAIVNSITRSRQGYEDNQLYGSGSIYQNYLTDARKFLQSWGLGWLFIALECIFYAIVVLALFSFLKNFVRIYRITGFSLRLFYAFSGTWTADYIKDCQNKNTAVMLNDLNTPRIMMIDSNNLNTGSKKNRNK